MAAYPAFGGGGVSGASCSPASYRFCQIDCLLANERSLNHANQQSPNRRRIIWCAVVTKLTMPALVTRPPLSLRVRVRFVGDSEQKPRPPCYRPRASILLSRRISGVPAAEMRARGTNARRDLVAAARCSPPAPKPTSEAFFMEWHDRTPAASRTASGHRQRTSSSALVHLTLWSACWRAIPAPLTMVSTDVDCSVCAKLT